MFCSNCVKFGRREISEIVRAYLTKTFRLALQLLLLRGLRPKFARASPQQCIQSAPDFIYMVHFSRSYSRTCERRQNMP